MYPEAGGSSSFARHAFNELASFFAAWAQMLNYVITVAISAFFVPHYLSVFWAPLKHGPGDVIGGVDPGRAAGGAEHQGDPGVVAAQPGAGDRRPVHAGRAGRDRRRAGAQPGHPGQQRPPRHRADLGQLRARDRGRDDRLHRDRDDLEHGRGGAGRSPDDPARGRPRGARGDRALRADPDRRAVGDAGDAGRRRPLHDRPRDAVRRRPGARDRREPRARTRGSPTPCGSTSGSSPR